LIISSEIKFPKIPFTNAKIKEAAIAPSESLRRYTAF
jgi:hypothetical protein